MLARPKPYLDILTTAERGALTPLLTDRILPAGAPLFCQGDQPRCLFIILRGCVKVRACTGLGRDIITELLFEGDVCGALCALGGRPYPVGAQCIQPVVATTVGRNDFMAVVEDHPGLLCKAIACCRHKMLVQREMMIGMAVEHVRERTYRALVLLAAHVGVVTSEGVEISLELSRQEFSEIIGTTPETAIRMLSRLKKEGRIREREGRIVVLDTTDLPQLSQAMAEPCGYCTVSG